MTIEGIGTERVRNAGPFTIRQITYPAGYRQGWHEHAYASVTLVVSGSLLESAAAGVEVASALSVVVKPAGVSHADEVGREAVRTLQVGFEPGDLPGGTGLDRWRWVHAGAGTATMLSLMRLMSLGGASAELEECAVDAIGSLAGSGSRALREPPAWLRRAREALEASVEPASVRALAGEAGVHEVSLSRAFRDCYGCTLSEYRRRVRLRRAARSVAAGAANLSRVAHASGYSDHPHLAREFRRTTGLAPSEYRALAGDRAVRPEG